MLHACRDGRRRPASGRLALVSVLVGGFLVPMTAAAPPAGAVTVTASLVRTVALSDVDPPSPDPSGITWDAANSRLLVSDSEVEEMAIFEDANVFELAIDGTLTGSGDLTPPLPGFTNEPTGLSLDPGSGHLFVSDDMKDEVTRLAPGNDGDFGTPDDVVVASVETDAFGNTDPEDVAYDTSTGDLYTADGAGREVYRIEPGFDGVFNGVPPEGDDVVTSFDTAQYGAQGSEGLGYDPVRGTLLVVDPATKMILETTTSGTLLNRIDLSVANPRHPEDVVLAPSFANPSVTNLYVVARGQDNNANPNENDGTMHELAVSLPSMGNQAPIANAGPDRTVTLPAGITLAGSVTDDGLPAGSTLTSLWAKVSGPGTATFSDATASSTTVTFSAPGTYVLRLTADDTALQHSDDVIVTVNPEGTVALDIPVVASADDAEENTSGAVNKGSSDLQLAFDATAQTVGVRFRNVAIPVGSTIVEAHVQFATKTTSSSTVNLVIEGQSATNPQLFKTNAFNISSRPRTDADVQWTPDPWTLAGEAGSAQQTANLAPVIQEIVGLPGWSGVGHMVLIVTGDGAPTQRTAWSYNGTGPEPVLHVEYLLPA